MTACVKSIALAAVLAGATTGASAAIVANGDFETGNLSGWTVNDGIGTTPDTGIQVITTDGTPNVPYNGDVVNAYQGTGDKAAFFVDDRAIQTLSQYVTLQAGQTYTLEFGLYGTESGDANPNFYSLTNWLTLTDFPDFDFAVGDINFDSQVMVGDWEKYTYTFTAGYTSSNYQLGFNFISGRTPAKDVLLDGVSITAVPEPSTWAMMIGGLGLVGVALRRRKTTVSFA